MHYSVINPKWNNHVPFDGRFSWNRAYICSETTTTTEKKWFFYRLMCIFCGQITCTVNECQKCIYLYIETHRKMMKHCNKNHKNCIYVYLSFGVRAQRCFFFFWFLGLAFCVLFLSSKMINWMSLSHQSPSHKHYYAF